MSNIIKGITQEGPVTKKEPEVHVPGYGTIPLDMLKRHVQSLSKDFDTLIQQGAFLKAAYRSEQFYNALMALAKALPKPNKVDEGEVVSLEARRSPLVVAGSPYDWDIYDLRTNKMVANILGGDRHESPLYEIRIRSSGMTPTTRMLPTYVLRAGRNNNPPYKAYELVDTPERYGKIEKSPGPGGTTKLHPDQDDMLRHMMKSLGGGKYYGYDLNLVEEGLDQYQIIEKALGAKIMEIDDAMELGFTDVDPEDSSSIIYLGNQKNEGYSAGASGGAGLGEDTAYAGGGGQGGYAGQSYRKFKPKPAGTNEEQAPMFTPEEKMVNANDPMSDGWRFYEIEPSGSKEEIDEISNFLALRQKDDEYKKTFGSTPVYKQGDKVKTKFSNNTVNLIGTVIDFDLKTKKVVVKTNDGKMYFVHAQNLEKINQESAIMKGITK